MSLTDGQSSLASARSSLIRARVSRDSPRVRLTRARLSQTRGRMSESRPRFSQGSVISSLASVRHALILDPSSEGFAHTSEPFLHGSAGRPQFTRNLLAFSHVRARSHRPVPLHASGRASGWKEPAAGASLALPPLAAAWVGDQSLAIALLMLRRRCLRQAGMGSSFRPCHAFRGRELSGNHFPGGAPPARGADESNAGAHAAHQSPARLPRASFDRAGEFARGTSPGWDSCAVAFRVSP